jgi:hypothetical protein
MVTALRSGPPPIPPAQPNRAVDAARLPEFARSLPAAEAGAGPSRTQAPGQVQGATSAAVSRPQPENDPSRPVRTPRPGSLVDIRV